MKAQSSPPFAVRLAHRALSVGEGSVPKGGLRLRPELGPSLRARPGAVLSTARSAVSKPAATKTEAQRRMMNERGAFMNDAGKEDDP